MIVFFDGVCNLCQRSVRYLIKYDNKGILKFASLQGNYAKTFLPDSELKSIESILFYDGKSLSKKSTAIINLCKILGGWHHIMLLGFIVPKFIRDGIYGIVAKNRYRWFGKQDKCMRPLKSLESRFLD